MKQYHLKQSDSLPEMKQFNLDKKHLVIEDTEDIKGKNLIVLEDTKYELDKELPTNSKKVNTILGYIESGKREKQQININGKDKLIVGNIDSKYPILQNKKKGQKIVGYIKVEDMDYYIAITVRSKKVLIIPIIFCMIVYLALNINNINPLEPVDPSQFRIGDKGKGEITTNSETKPLETEYFNVNLNVTPTIQNEHMNLRIVNRDIVNDKENKLSCVVKVYLIDTADKDGKELGEIEEPILIYESPLINPSESIENCELDSLVEPGRYVARAVYDIYDSNFYLVGQTAAKLDIVSK